MPSTCSKASSASCTAGDVGIDEPGSPVDQQVDVEVAPSRRRLSQQALDDWRDLIAGPGPGASRTEKFACASTGSTVFTRRGEPPAMPLHVDRRLRPVVRTIELVPGPVVRWARALLGELVAARAAAPPSPRPPRRSARRSRRAAARPARPSGPREHGPSACISACIAFERRAAVHPRVQSRSPVRTRDVEVAEAAQRRAEAGHVSVGVCRRRRREPRRRPARPRRPSRRSSGPPTSSSPSIAKRRLTGSSPAAASSSAALSSMNSWPLSSATPRATSLPSRSTSVHGSDSQSSSGSGGCTSKWPYRGSSARRRPAEARTSPDQRAGVRCGPGSRRCRPRGGPVPRPTPRPRARRPLRSGSAVTEGIAISSASSSTRASWDGITGAHCRDARDRTVETSVARRGRPCYLMTSSGVVAGLVQRHRAREARHARPARFAHARAVGAVVVAAEGVEDPAAPPTPGSHQSATRRSGFAHATSLTLAASASARSFFRLWCSIWRIRSRVTLNARPTSSSVRGCWPSSP